MYSFQIQLVLLLLFVGVQSINYCGEYETHQTCINSDIEQCMWLSNRKLCQKTNDYLQGCSLTLNKKACIRQIGNAQGQPAKCRFINICEVIPNIKTERCLNNLSKSGCLAIQNPEQICFWKDNKCQVLYQNQWNQVQKDFDTVPYSASACFLIENYLVIHNTLLWDLISYTPNLYAEADRILKQEMGLLVNDTINFDNPNTVSMQNNYQFANGSYAWYTIRESKEIKLSNLYKSYRYRDGCIALEIENDADFLILLRLTEQVRGINHIYCKYLNKNPSITKQFVYSDGVCKVFDKVDLNNQKKIMEFNLSCKSIDYYQCIYFYSNSNICRLKGIEYEYPCVTEESEYVANCDDADCTVRQCSKQSDYYMDTTTNKCSKSCSSFTIKTKEACEAIKGCKFLGAHNIFFTKICAPSNSCDQLGLQNLYCSQLVDQCGWDNQLQRCYQITDEQSKLLKCEQAFNAGSCMRVALSDQMCFWDYMRRICYNIVDQPILITHKALMDYEYYFAERYLKVISNRNFCKYQQNVVAEYLPEQGKCILDSRFYLNDLKQINSYSCIMVQPGYCKWDPYQQICISLAETEVSQLNCLEQELVNERICQKSKVSNPDMICIYDSDYNFCKEIKMSEFELYGCEGYGFSKEYCVNKQKLGEQCQFSAGKCKSISESYINSILCPSLQNVNQYVCQLYSSSSKVCLYDEITHSCYTPSIYTRLSYTKHLNCYGCQQVKDSYTYFSLELKKCIQFSDINVSILSSLECTQNFVNEQTCLSIIKDDQNCYWDTQSNQCKRYTEYFINCAEYANQNYRVCTALASDMSKQFMKDNYCTYENNICQSKSNYLLDCGESEQMNIHRCSGLTGLSPTGEYIQMCAFLNNKCKTLIDNSMNTYIVLTTIQCKQANLKACTKVETNGQYCKLIDFISANNIIIDKKCVQIDTTTETCSTINTNISINLINPNHCSRANDSCYYDSVNGCQSPVETNLECNTQGLSYLGCILNTQNHRCGFVNNKCKYLAQYSNVSDCKYLNQFSCSYYAFNKCYWNGQLCVLSTNDTTEYGSDYNCSLNTSSTFIVSNGITCQTIQQQSNYELYSCDSQLNQFACGSIPNQYCQFIQNKCQFYSHQLCDDSQQTCSDNNSLNMKCVLKDGKCFNLPNNNYSCDFFDKTNYEFCLQYPNCVYVDQKCQHTSQISVYWYCDTLSLLKCVLQNKSFACSWSSGYCSEYTGTSCPSLNGFYSFNACQQFENCTYGFTKRGLGFCYSDKNFESLTCEQLNQDLCLEDLSHVNSSLFCYWDQSCKNIYNNQITLCTDLSEFKSSYAACKQLNQEQCMYSFIDQKCKLISEFNSTICQGITAKQCSQIQNTCYFDGSVCSETGEQNQLNKYGCIKQSGTWKFTYFKCNQIINELQKSCHNLSKDACLSDLTKELICQWKDDKCQNVLQKQNKQLNTCDNLNQRACQNVRLSNIFCVWNETLKSCDSLTVTNTDCVNQNFAITTSMSVCSGQTNKYCAKYYDNTKCTEINVKVNNCNLYGLNKQACIQLTSVPCQWVQINDGGYCDDANLYSVHCIDQLNQQACLNVQTYGQVCKWDQLNQVCQDQEISTCESASNLNSLYACNAVVDEPCIYDPMSKLCNKIVFIPKSCSINFNKPTCEMASDNCIWESNRCITSPYKNCQQYTTKSKCLESNQINCQWLNNQCTDFNQLYSKIFCKDLPNNINIAACSNNAKDPCKFDKKSASCQPDQDFSTYFLKTISSLILMQTPDYKSPLLSGKCEQLLTKDYCMKSRIKDMACVWKNSSCQEVTDLENIKCTDYLNLQGCLNVKKDDQLCFWRDQKCLIWNPTITQMENVNKNVCIYYSINCVYESNSCIKKDIQTILCTSEGISKITCLSIPNQKCQWLNSCIEFTLTQQRQCSDFKDVSSYVCQMIPNLSCVYDNENNSCMDFKNDVVGLGVSKLACIQNKSIPIYWNGTVCQELTDTIECDSQLIVNEYSCRSQVQNTKCIYDVDNNQCTSFFNIWSLKCNTLGLNFLGCVSIQQEPCIFKNNQCQLFREVQSSCMLLSLVNSKACASIIDQYCAYDPIYYKCQTPLITQDYCNIEGINKNVCIENEICMWNQDNLDCKCKSIQEIDSCQQSDISKCRAQNKCYFDLEQYRCVKKQCYHFKEDECDQILDNKICYRSLKKGCQPATKCEDIIDPKNNCQSIFINSQPCVQAGDLCITSTNYKLYCPYSNCSNSNCIFYYGTCKMRTCEDHNSIDCNENEGCYLDQENNCQELLRCSQISQDIYGDQVINICNKSSVGGFKCNWQKQQLTDDTEICTNKVCQIYGASQTICLGNEINGYSCVYFDDLICRQCEQITEQCICNQQKNVCIYKNGKCRSILCSSFLTKENCNQATDRCYWSIQKDSNNVQQGICVKECGKILNEDDCNSRINECYFDNQNGLCIKGKKEIPDLSSEIYIEEFYSIILTIFICVNMIIYV